MISLAILVEGSACAWGSYAELKRDRPGHESEVLSCLMRAIVSFANAHLSLSASNRLLLYTYADGIKKKLLYDSLRSESPDSSSCMIGSLRNALSENALSGDSRQCGLLAATLATAICQLRKAAIVSAQVPVGTEGGSSSTRQSGRIVIISLSPLFGSQHSLLMNLFFSAHKHDICVDVVSLGGSSALLQQAADITAGVFVEAPRPEELVRVLMTRCLPVSRRIESHSSVDFRAACACHETLVSNGWTCSVCLAVLCTFLPICPSCGAVFKIAALGRRKRKRPTEVMNGNVPSNR